MIGPDGDGSLKPWAATAIRRACAADSLGVRIDTAPRIPLGCDSRGRRRGYAVLTFPSSGTTTLASGAFFCS